MRNRLFSFRTLAMVLGALTLLSCGNFDGSFLRSLGFRVNQSSTTQIVEKVHYQGEVYHLSPEGRKRRIKFQRLGFFEMTEKGSIPITFLENTYPHFFFSFGDSSFWIGVKYAQKPEFQLEYNPGLESPLEVLVFSVGKGVLHRFDFHKYQVLYPRGGGVLYFRDIQSNSVYTCFIGPSGIPVVEHANSEVSMAFNKALEQGWSFSYSLAFFELTQNTGISTNLDRTDRLVYTNGEGELRHTLIPSEVGPYMHQFIFRKQHETWKAQLSDQVILPSTAIIQNGVIWYYELKATEYSMTNTLKSATITNN